MLRLRERSWRQIWRFVVMPQPLPHRVEPDQEVRQRVGNLVGVLVPLDPDAQRLWEKSGRGIGATSVGFRAHRADIYVPSIAGRGMPGRKRTKRTTVKDVRAILRLSHVQGLSMREVAARLKLSRETISTPTPSSPI